VTDGTSLKTVTATLANLGRLQINTLGGDDHVTVDVNGTALIAVPITFDGGSGSDLLTVQGTPSTGNTARRTRRARWATRVACRKWVAGSR